MNYVVVTQVVYVRSNRVDSLNCQVIACVVSYLTLEIYGDQEVKITVYLKFMVNLASKQT